MKQKTKGAYIIAEAGVNHNGSLDMALRLVDVAAEAGADAVKFQTFKAERLVQRHAPKAAYQKQTTEAGESQYDMLRRLELPYEAQKTLLKYCGERKIDFLSTPFDEESLDFLTEDLGLQIIKLGSGEVTNGPLLFRTAQKGVALILSTGMSTLGEIETALSCLAFGYLGTEEVPSREAFLKAYASLEGREILERQVTLLHCTSEYPAPLEDVHLRSMLTMKEAFALRIGYSDHTEGIVVSVAAAALGASILEKHFTLDRALPGPDHKASLEPGELGELVRSVRQVEKALGESRKVPSSSEWENRGIVRKSLVAKCPISKGEFFTSENLACKRPGKGISPFDLWRFIGKVAPRDYEEDESLGE